MKGRTIHGWPIIEHADDLRLHKFVVPGTKRHFLLREDVGPYLISFVREYHEQVAPIDEGTWDDWGWAPVRKGRASDQVSDHCGGVAIDVNATREGAQNRANITWWRAPRRWLRFRALRRKYDLLEWGGDYQRFYDPMHYTFHFGVTAEDVKRRIRSMKIRPDGTQA